jgi:hypothetical protein
MEGVSEWCIIVDASEPKDRLPQNMDTANSEKTKIFHQSQGKADIDAVYLVAVHHSRRIG